jgi:hypothetical protein
VATAISKTRLRKVDTVDEKYAVATYEASHDGKVLGTITKYDTPAWKPRKNGKGNRDYREIGWAHSRNIGEGYETRADCVKDLERMTGVES